MKVFENIKVFSVCSVFSEKYESLYDELTEQTSPDCFIKYTITENDAVSSVFRKHYGLELGEEILIEIDY